MGESIQDAAGDLPLPSSPSEVKDIAQGLELSDVMILAGRNKPMMFFHLS